MSVKNRLQNVFAASLFLTPAPTVASFPNLREHPHPIAVELATKLPKDCVYSARGIHFFIGEPKCMRLFATKRLKGVWVLGFETSLFLPGAVKPPSDAELFRSSVWLETEGSSDAKAHAVMRNDGNGNFLVDMVAYAPPIEGAFGGRGATSRGVLLKRIISIRRLR